MEKLAQISGYGYYLPERELSNEHLVAIIDREKITEKWIEERTGVKKRYIASAKETSATMGAEAAISALRDAKMDANEIELIITASMTPHMISPNTSCFIQSSIGAKNAACIAVEAACAGFIQAIHIAVAFIKAGVYQRVMIIGSDKMSTFINLRDPNYCMFGDGAGAFILTPSLNQGFTHSFVRSDGTKSDLLKIEAGGSYLPATLQSVIEELHLMQMKGRPIFKLAIETMKDGIFQIINMAGLQLDDLDYIIPHQANLRILEALANQTEIPLSKFGITVPINGNTSSATLPITYAHAKRALADFENLKKLLFVSVGGGLNWGAALYQKLD